MIDSNIDEQPVVTKKRCEAAASWRIDSFASVPYCSTLFPETLTLPRCREAAVAKTMPLRTIFLSGDWVPLRLAPWKHLRKHRYEVITEVVTHVQSSKYL